MEFLQRSLHLEARLMWLRGMVGVALLFVTLSQATLSQSYTQRFTVDDAKRIEPVRNGEEAPDFTLEDLQGNPVKLSGARGKTATVVVFYRGYWCPFCARQLADLRSLIKDKEQVRLLAISVDDHETTKKFIEKISSDGNGSVNFTMLSDPDHKVIDRYGLHDPTYDGTKFDGIPHPAVYVIDKAGLVAWSKVESDFKVRPSNADIRTALESLN
jgi:peroxiredoxin